jgi:diadenosine tetraphosphate (Ap4A) HIT family hydrolase
MSAGCPFCSPENGEIVLRNAFCYARYDRYPLSDGHLLIVPFRHEPSYFSLTADERTAAFELLVHARAKLDSQLHIDGFNIGVNIGEAAGQTIMHAHIHLIPRYSGDVPDPRGGVRFVIPERANYWQDAAKERRLQNEEGETKKATLQIRTEHTSG